MSTAELPPAELDVMSCIWRGIETATGIREALADVRPLSHSSVCTLLKRLEEKQLVRREKGPVGKAYVYRPNVQSESSGRPMLKRLVDRLFGGSGVNLVASLLETNPPNDQELVQLEQLLKDLKTERAARGRSRRDTSNRRRPKR
jgi:BlaI family transcriptional regulator, penicillinase repressor